MLTDTPSPPTRKSGLKNPFLYSSIVLLLVAVYVGWIVYSRHATTQAYEERARESQAKKQHEQDQAAIEQLGGSELAIQMLYGTRQIKRGETAQICFGVANAKTVTLEPGENNVWPSHNLCVDVKPAKTTTYTLTATGEGGKTVAQQVTVAVH